MIPISIINNEQPSICSKCGRCCKYTTTALSPDQVDLTDKGIANRLSQGFMVDTYTNFHGTWYYIKPHAKENGECIFLTEKGCSFSFEDRPRVCQTYIPMPDMISCHQPEGYRFEDAVKAWEPYEHLLTHHITQ